MGDSEQWQSISPLSVSILPCPPCTLLSPSPSSSWMTSFACSSPSLLGRPVADEDEDELLRRLDSDVSSTMSVTFCYAAVYLLSLAKMRRGQACRERARRGATDGCRV